jgi:hypothetical protein
MAVRIVGRDISEEDSTFLRSIKYTSYSRVISLSNVLFYNPHGTCILQIVDSKNMVVVNIRYT